MSETFHLQADNNILISPPIFSSSDVAIMKSSVVTEIQRSQVDTQDASSNTSCTFVKNVFCGASAEIIATSSSSDDDKDEQETCNKEHNFIALDNVILAEFATDFLCSELYKIKQIKSKVNVIILKLNRHKTKKLMTNMIMDL